MNHGGRVPSNRDVDGQEVFEAEPEYEATEGNETTMNEDDNVDADNKVIYDDNGYAYAQGEEDEDGHGGGGEDLEEEEDQDVTIYWNIRRTTSKPVTCCCQLCGCWVFLIFILVALGSLVGSIEFTIGVPFYDRSEINQEREDAYAATERDADFVSTFFEADSGECVHKNPTWLARNGTLITEPAPSWSCQRATSQYLRILYVSSDRKSNILTPDNFEQIRQIENRILEQTQLPRYCYLLNTSYYAFETRNVDDWQQVLVDTADDEAVTAACERIESPLNHLDDLYFDTSGNESGLGYYLLPNDQVTQEYNYSQDFMDHVVNYWSNFGQQRTYDLSGFDAAVATVGDSVTVQNLFWTVTSSDFSTGSTTAIGVVSTYALGLPINGYASSSQSSDDQYEDVGQWLWDQFDSYLKDADFPGVDVYWSDNEDGMESAEEGYLAMQSISLFPISILLVWMYLTVMQDSLFVGVMGILQILLCFVPTLILYRYVIGQKYIGVLNLIAFYIILGIGVDDIFVFSDQFGLQSDEKRFDQRMQKTYNKASKAMFTTSCTTFISFISNYTSVFPAVSTFGLFSALLVLCNFMAVITFFPAVYAVYYTRVRHKWWDHPSRLVCCNRTPIVDANAENDYNGVGSSNKNVDGSEHNNDDDDDDGLGKGGNEDGGEESMFVRFFRDTWGPLMVKLRICILLLFVAVLAGALFLATQLTADEDAPSTLPDGNNYKEYPEVLLAHYSRSGNPRAIDVRWVSGINPDHPIDRAGTDDTISDDYGTANYNDCATYDPNPPESQVWSLQTCHDLFFGNVTDYHGGDDSFGPDGANGPKARKMVTDNVLMEEYYYYRVVTCPAQGFRDWLLTDNGCDSLLENGLECYNVTSQRAGCTSWDPQNSCEPYPVPTEKFEIMFQAFFADEDTNPSTQLTNYDTFKTQVFVDDEFELDSNKVVQDDFTCRYYNGSGVLVAMSAVATLDQDFAQNYEDGIALYDLWNAWSVQMQSSAPREMKATMQVSNGAWSFYFLNETLLEETFMGIMLALVLSFVVLTLVGGNIFMAAISVFTILLIVIDIVAFTVIVGWDLGVIEAVNYVVVIGMSIDYCVHMSEAYTEAHGHTRREKVILMIEEMGVSVLSGALSTLLATAPMFFAPNTFFVKFASFLFCTIALSCIYALTFFPALLSLIGPLGKTGMVWPFFTELRQRLVHDFTKRHVQSKQFAERERREQDMRESGALAAQNAGETVDEGDPAPRRVPSNRFQPNAPLDEPSVQKVNI